MAEFRLTVDTRVLNNILRQLPGNTGEMVRKTAFFIEGEAKKRAPVDTGNLKNSLQASQVRPETWRVSDGVEYGVYQELGTYKMAAQPFLQPAVFAAERTLKKMAEELVDVGR